jgi:hypothetical protein
VANQLEQHQLWSALSNLFVGSEVDYKQVAGVAKNYAIKDVEFALFERVAPVCISNMLTPIPPVWWYFDEEQLIADIEFLVKKRAKQGVMGRCLSALTRRLIRLVSAKVWAELKVEIELAKRNG